MPSTTHTTEPAVSLTAEQQAEVLDLLRQVRGCAARTQYTCRSNRRANAGQLHAMAADADAQINSLRRLARIAGVEF